MSNDAAKRSAPWAEGLSKLTEEEIDREADMLYETIEALNELREEHGGPKDVDAREAAHRRRLRSLEDEQIRRLEEASANREPDIIDQARQLLKEYGFDSGDSALSKGDSSDGRLRR